MRAQSFPRARAERCVSELCPVQGSFNEYENEGCTTGLHRVSAQLVPLEDPEELLNQLRKVHLITLSDRWEFNTPSGITLSIPEAEVTPMAWGGFYNDPLRSSKP